MSKRSTEKRLSLGAPPYLLGTDTKEFERLKAQHQVWSGATSRLWDLAKFGPGTRLLDLGCGPGFAAIELADRVGADGGAVAVGVLVDDVVAKADVSCDGYPEPHACRVDAASAGCHRVDLSAGQRV